MKALYNIPGNSPEGVYDYYVDCRGQRTVCGSGVTVVSGFVLISFNFRSLSYSVSVDRT